MNAKVFVTLVGLLTLCAFGDPGAREAEISHLLTFVRTSGVVFLRNGDEHSAEEAAEHIAKKAKHFQKDIDSTERFVELTATRSLVSKKPYQVRHPDGTLQPSGEWLLEELARHRQSQPSSPP
jgi:hypothetical protein